MTERRQTPRRQSDRILHGWARRIVAAFLLLLAAAIIAVGKLQLDTQHTENQQQNALVAGCDRLNTLQIKENVSHLADWRVFRAVATLRVLDQDFTLELSLQEAISAKTWTPPLDCSATVRKHGSGYVLPEPIPFDVRIPPRSALVVPR